MARTRSSGKSQEDDFEERDRATEYEWDEEPSLDHPAKGLEVRRATASPKSPTSNKRGRLYYGEESDDTDDEDSEPSRTRAKRLKRTVTPTAKANKRGRSYDGAGSDYTDDEDDEPLRKRVKRNTMLPKSNKRRRSYDGSDDTDDEDDGPLIKRAKRDTASPRSKKRGRSYDGAGSDDTDSEDDEPLMNHVKRLKRDSSIDSVEVEVVESAAAKLFKSSPIEVSAYLSL